MNSLNTMLTDVYAAFGWQPLTWFAVLVALNLMDVVLTLYALKRGGAEGNPLVNWLMRKFGVEPGLVGAKAVALGIVFYALPTAAIYMPLACLLYVGVVVWNVYHISKLRG